MKMPSTNTPSAFRKAASSLDKAANLIGALAGTLADIGGAIGFVNFVVGLFGQTDALAEAVHEIITTIITALEEEFATSDQLAVMRRVADLLPQARNAVNLIRQAIAEHRPLTDSESTTARSDSFKVVETLGGPRATDIGYGRFPETPFILVVGRAQ